MIVFSAEYVLRLWSCVDATESVHPWRERIRHALRPLMLVDLLAILPFYPPMIATDLRPLRVLRVLRGLRVLKLGRYSSSLQLLHRVVVSCRYQLVALSSVAALLELLAACLMRLAEREAQPDVFSTVSASAWWAIVTVATVAPVTPLGKVLAGIIALLGVLVIALPTAILGSAMLEELRARREGRCPRCGATPASPDGVSQRYESPQV